MASSDVAGNSNICQALPLLRHQPPPRGVMPAERQARRGERQALAALRGGVRARGGVAAGRGE